MLTLKLERNQSNPRRYCRKVVWRRTGDKVERLEIMMVKGREVSVKALPINDRPRDWSTLPSGGDESVTIAKRDWLLNQEYIRTGDHQWAIHTAQWFGHVEAYPSDKSGYPGCFIVTETSIEGVL